MGIGTSSRIGGAQARAPSELPTRLIVTLLRWGGLPAPGRRPQPSPARCMSSNCAGAGSHAVRVSDRRIWVFCALGAGSCARCVYEERDPILEVLLTCRVYYRDFQPVAADTEIGR